MQDRVSGRSREPGFRALVAVALFMVLFGPLGAVEANSEFHLPHKGTMALDKPYKQYFPMVEKVDGIALQMVLLAKPVDGHNAEIVGDSDMLYKNPIAVALVFEEGSEPKDGKLHSIMLTKSLDDSGQRIGFEW